MKVSRLKCPKCKGQTAYLDVRRLMDGRTQFQKVCNFCQYVGRWH